MEARRQSNPDSPPISGSSLRIVPDPRSLSSPCHSLRSKLMPRSRAWVCRFEIRRPGHLSHLRGLGANQALHWKRFLDFLRPLAALDPVHQFSRWRTVKNASSPAFPVSCATGCQSGAEAMRKLPKSLIGTIIPMPRSGIQCRYRQRFWIDVYDCDIVEWR